MKILIVLKAMKQKNTKIVGGVSNSNLELQNSLKKLGHEVDILSREDDLKIYSCIKSIFPLRREVFRLLEKEYYDIIFTQDWSLTFPLLFPYKMVTNRHIANFCGREETKSKFMQNWVGKKMGKDLSVIGDRLHWAFPEATKIYRGVNFKKFKPLGKERKYIGWVDKSSELITKEQLKKISKQIGLKLLIAKDIPTEKLNEEFYNKCKAFVSLPPQAGFNNVWLEAMASGVPIVIGNSQGAGWFLPFDRVFGRDYVEQIVRIINKPIKTNYRRWLIDNDFSWDDKAKELENFFEIKLEKGGTH